jgi:copper resistance protein B
VRCEVLFTNRLILQPLVELEWYGQDDAATGIGAGLATGELGLRLRYEIRREIAPYIGIVREKSFGSTADYARASGRDADDTRLVAGVRLWF